MNEITQSWAGSVADVRDQHARGTRSGIADAGGARHRESTPPARWRGAFARTLFTPDQTVTPPAVLGAIVILAATVAALRMGPHGMNTLWAEDGQVFYSGARQGSFLHNFFETYRGYMHAAPRLVVAAAALFPLSWAAVTVTLGNALVLGLLAAVVYCASAPHIHQRTLRIIPAALIAACPVGPETIGSVANLQWFLVPAAFLVLLWNPQRPLPIAAGVVTVVFATLSSPFGVFLAPLAVVRAVVLGRRRGALIPLAAMGGIVVQGLIMMSTHDRDSYDEVRPGTLSRMFVDYVAGQGTTGVRYFTELRITGIVVLGVLGALFLLAAAARLLPQLTAAALFVLFSVLFFTAPIVLSGMTIGKPGGNRYFVTPFLLLAFAVMTLTSASLSRIDQGGWVWQIRPFGMVLRGALAASLVFSCVTCVPSMYSEARFAPTWSGGLDQARKECRAGARLVAIPITPVSAVHNWRVVLKCSQVGSG